MTRPIHLFIALLFVALVGVSGEVRAREVIFGLDQSVSGDSNVFIGPQGREPDGSYRVGPTVRFREKNDRINYDFFYVPTYQKYFTLDNIDGWNHDYIGRLEWGISPRTTLSLLSKAYLHRAAANLTDLSNVDPGASALGLGDIGRYQVELKWNRSFTNRLQGNVTGRYDQWTFENTSNRPNISGTGELGGTYAVVPQWLLGFSVDGTYRRFDELVSRGGVTPPLTSIVAAASVVTQYQASDSLSFYGSIGPSYVRQRQDSSFGGTAPVFRYRAARDISTGDTLFAPFTNCVTASPPPLLQTDCLFSQGETAADSSVSPVEVREASLAPGEVFGAVESDFATFFAVAQIQKSWPRGSLSLAYIRSQDASGGVAATTIADSVTLDVTHRLNRRSRISFYARFTARDTNADQAFLSPIAVASSNLSNFGNPLAENGDLVVVEGENQTSRAEVLMSVTLSRQLSKSLQIRGQFIYADTFTDRLFINVNGSISDSPQVRFTRFLGRLVLRYELDPIRF